MIFTRTDCNSLHKLYQLNGDVRGAIDSSIFYFDVSTMNLGILSTDVSKAKTYTFLMEAVNTDNTTITSTYSFNVILKDPCSTATLTSST